MNTKMKIHRKGYAAGWKVLAVAVMAVVASIADATQTIVPIEMPVVEAGAGDGSSGTVKTLDFMTDELRTLIHAEAAAGSVASAKGELGLVDVHKARSSANGGAWVESWTQFTVDDPQGRPEVKTILKFNAVASAGTPAPGLASLTSSATVIVTIGPSDGSGVQLRVDNDTLSSEIIHRPFFVSKLFQLLASGQTGLFNNADGQPIVPTSLCEGGIWMNGQAVSRRPSAEGCSADTERGRLELTHAPGTYVMQVLVFASFNGLAVSDPIWEPHPDNPDVIVTRHSPTGLPSAPLAGTNPDDLTAQGIDPTPFIEAGFFDPPTSEPPPAPPPASKYWCGPGFWLNNAVSFGASAWPVTVPTYYDYNSTAGQLAGCPTASNNPTLLGVLQDPKRYFSTQLRGAGFNCVGDYLSGKSGLVGTMADNNGVCSIDQFGQHTE
jgi:hypothetical protein